MFISYLIIRLFTLPFAFLSYRVIHFLGRHLGSLAYYLIPKFRKRALSNLALSDLGLSNACIRKTAKASIGRKTGHKKNAITEIFTKTAS